MLGSAILHLVFAVLRGLNGGVGGIVSAAVFLIFLSHVSSILLEAD